ncbi:MAG: prolyl oligopeptidase family serine peptidase [Bacteroidota bacterium]
MKRHIIYLLLVIIPCSSGFGQENNQKRNFEVDDLFRKEVFSGNEGIDFNPVYSEYTYVMARPRNKSTRYGGFLQLFGYNRSDIYVRDYKRKTITKITDGDVDGAGFYNPCWSPDGKKLVMLSNRGGDYKKICVWVWDRTTKVLEKLNETQIPPFLNLKFRWFSNDMVLYQVAGGKKQASLIETFSKTAELLNEKQLQTIEEKEPSYGVLESKEDRNAPMGMGTKIVKQNIVTKEVHFSNVDYFQPNPDGSGSYFSLLSPNKEYLAGLVLASKEPLRAGEPINLTGCNDNLALKIFKDDKIVDTPSLNKLKSVLNGSLKWSPDGETIYLIGTENNKRNLSEIIMDQEEDQFFIYRYTIRTDELLKINTGLITPKIDKNIYSYKGSLVSTWTNKGELVFYGEHSESGRYDWFSENSSGLRNLTTKLSKAPKKLYRDYTGKSFIAAVEGKVIRISESGKVSTVFDSADRAVKSILDFDNVNKTHLLYTTKNKEEFYRLNVKNGSSLRLEKPNPQADYIRTDFSNGISLFSLDNNGGTLVWESNHEVKQNSMVLGVNNYLKEIEPGTYQDFEYKSLKGDTLTALILLPPDYDAKKKYPVITYGYPGTMYHKGYTPVFASIGLSNTSFFNLEILAAKGYVILYPSMPLTSSSTYLDLTDGVIPAVNTLIRDGIADPERLAIMGVSFGGYSTVGLIEQTDIFKTAIALNGKYNELGNYGNLAIHERYTENPIGPLSYTYRWYESEYSNSKLESTPWENPQTYLQNSPFLYIDRINTPLMLIHGDMDNAVPIEQSDQLFMGLYRLGKKAKYITYWGESHLMGSPANIKHMWDEIFNWLDETGCRPDSP